MTLVALALACSLPVGQEVHATPAELAAPVQLTAGDQVVDISEDHSYSGPWVTDVDLDGKADLVVTSIFGKLRWYKNVSETAEPSYEHQGHLKLGEEDLKFWNW